MVAVQWVLHDEYSSSAVGYKYVQFGRNICSVTYTKNLKYLFTSTFHIINCSESYGVYTGSCLLIGMCSLYVAFEGHISFWHVHWDNMYPVI